MQPIKERGRKLLDKVAIELKNRHFDAYVCDNTDEMKKTLSEIVPDGSSVSWGGSYSIVDSGALDFLSSKCNMLDRAKAPDRNEFMKVAMFCDFFLASANALSEDGVIVNVDAFGTRIAPIIYGPQNVILIVGVNKIVKSEEDAIIRSRTVAAPINSQRFDISTPCKVDGECHNCKCPDSICATIVKHRLCNPEGRIKVILVNENLGF